LLDEHFLVGVFELRWLAWKTYFYKESVAVGVDGAYDRVEGFNALGGVLN